MRVVMASTILRPVARTSRPRHPFLDWPGPIAFAHRGGASEAPENTMPAFERAVDLGYRYLETDVHVTADGVVVAFHDDDLLPDVRPARAHLRAAVARRWPTARVDGREPIPRLADLLDAWPDARFNIDCKTDRVVEPLGDELRRDRRARPGLRRRVQRPPPGRACAGASVRRCARAPGRSSSALLRFLGVAAPRSLAAQVPVR